MNTRFNELITRCRPNAANVWRVVAAVAFVALVWATSDWWQPAVERLISQPADSSAEDEAEPQGAPGDSIELSAQARRNISLETGEVRAGEYARSITVPAMVIERPGRTRLQVAAPTTGVVTAINVLHGEAVTSGRRLFRMRLNHEDLVQAQTDFLKTLGQLDVEEREIARLERVSGGAVAQQVVLQRKYERDKLQAALNAQREALRLHPLSPEQIEWIAEERRLIREVTVMAPEMHADASLHDDAELAAGETPVRTVAQSSSSPADERHEVVQQRFVVDRIAVEPGEAVETGHTLCTLSDYRYLDIEGRAFEQDAEELVRAANEAWTVTAIPESSPHGAAGNADRLSNQVGGLTITAIASEVDPESRALHFHVDLPNEIVRNVVQGDGREFLTWRYKPGQRMQLLVPVEFWPEVIVLPVDAVAQEGPEFYVFVENGDHFDRRPVHVKYRDQFDVVVENDGSLFPGESVALSGAHQLLMALKQKSGGGGGHAHHGHVH